MKTLLVKTGTPYEIKIERGCCDGPGMRSAGFRSCGGPQGRRGHRL